MPSSDRSREVSYDIWRCGNLTEDPVFGTECLGAGTPSIPMFKESRHDTRMPM